MIGSPVAGYGSSERFAWSGTGNVVNHPLVPAAPVDTLQREYTHGRPLPRVVVDRLQIETDAASVFTFNTPATAVDFDFLLRRRFAAAGDTGFEEVDIRGRPGAGIFFTLTGSSTAWSVTVEYHYE